MTLGKPFCRSGDVSSASDAAKDAVVDAAAVAAAADVRSRDVRTSRLRRTHVLLFAGVVFDTLSLTQKRSLTQTQYLTFSSTVSFVSGLSLSHMYIAYVLFFLTCALWLSLSHMNTAHVFFFLTCIFYSLCLFLYILSTMLLLYSRSMTTTCSLLLAQFIFFTNWSFLFIRPCSKVLFFHHLSFSPFSLSFSLNDPRCVSSFSLTNSFSRVLYICLIQQFSFCPASFNFLSHLSHISLAIPNHSNFFLQIKCISSLSFNINRQWHSFLSLTQLTFNIIVIYLFSLFFILFERL